MWEGCPFVLPEGLIIMNEERAFVLYSEAAQAMQEHSPKPLQEWRPRATCSCLWWAAQAYQQKGNAAWIGTVFFRVNLGISWILNTKPKKFIITERDYGVYRNETALFFVLISTTTKTSKNLSSKQFQCIFQDWSLLATCASFNGNYRNWSHPKGIRTRKTEMEPDSPVSWHWKSFPQLWSTTHGSFGSHASLSQRLPLHILPLYLAGCTSCLDLNCRVH